MVRSRVVGRSVDVSESLISFAKLFARKRGDDIECILFSPQPFTPGEVFIISKNNINSTVELLSYANTLYQLKYRLYCLRKEELWELGAAHWFIPSGGTYFPSPAYTLRSLGVILYGVDLRDQIPLPERPEHFLLAHIEGCRFYVRNHQILKRLTTRDYAGLIDRMIEQFHYLMASAVVIKTTEGFLEQELEKIFARVFAGTRALHVWVEFRDSVIGAKPDREAAFETVWLFECFMRALQEIAA